MLAHNALPFSELEKPIGSNVLISCYFLSMFVYRFSILGSFSFINLNDYCFLKSTDVVGLIIAMEEMLLQWLHVW